MTAAHIETCNKLQGNSVWRVSFVAAFSCRDGLRLRTSSDHQMRWILWTLAIAFFLVPQATFAETLYVLDFGNPGDLYSVDSTDASVTFVGTTDVRFGFGTGDSDGKSYTFDSIDDVFKQEDTIQPAMGQRGSYDA